MNVADSRADPLPCAPCARQDSTKTFASTSRENRRMATGSKVPCAVHAAGARWREGAYLFRWMASADDVNRVPSGAEFSLSGRLPSVKLAARALRPEPGRSDVQARGVRVLIVV